MDWVRLGNSGANLSGTRGIVTPVSHAELGKHNRVGDAWLAIRGKVYNVTRYMDFHPGGVEELMRGVGIDATKVFDEVHAWVNYEQLLAKCYIGPLRTTMTLNIASPGSSKKERSLSVSRDAGSSLFKPPFLPFMSFDKSPSTIPITPDVPQSTDVIPRFDWIQKTAQLTLVFYTKSACNPGMLVRHSSNPSTLDISIQIDHNEHLFSFALTHNVEWPPVHVISNNETGKLEVVLNKSNPALWTNFGTLDRRKNIETAHCDYSYEICEHSQITHDSYALVLRPKQNIVQIYPIGYHFSATATIEGKLNSLSVRGVPSNNFLLPQHAILHVVIHQFCQRFYPE